MMTAAWKTDLEGLMVVHEMRTSRRPWAQADSRSPHALEPKSRVPGGRRSFRQLDLGCPNTRNFGPSNDTPIHAMQTTTSSTACEHRGTQVALLPHPQNQRRPTNRRRGPQHLPGQKQRDRAWRCQTRRDPRCALAMLTITPPTVSSTWRRAPNLHRWQSTH